ncbi:OmpA/MotB family protein [Sneathiella chinensis]|uniref:OmpA-like domain-containing protein n=1 Tax=Sneathiella chinensis TaxID=349750 RepID=A0ABQ5U6T6_9PROT|nr:flagellar motor protein MotB [Sneathiella chinensis]GLQ07393.1 hypothetical protein GCM10007924_26140 [Sneathiella chinensis]
MIPSDLYQPPAPKRRNSMWLTSLADLLALLLVFFVLLFSMSEVKQESWEKILDTLGYKLNEQVTETEDGPTAEKTVELFSERRAFDLDYLANILGEKFAASPEMADIEMFKASGRLVISFIGDSYFERGGNRATDTLTEIMGQLGESLRYMENRVEIYGHTDPKPFLSESSRFINNWGLSLARALAVAEQLEQAGYGYPIRVFGMADSRFYELGDIPDREKRFSRARRVDIVIREAAGWKRNRL